MAEIISTDIPPVPHQWFMADDIKPFDTFVIIGHGHSPQQVETVREAAEEASKEGRNTLIIGDGENDIPVNYLMFLKENITANTQIILCGHGNDVNSCHSITLIERQKDIAQTIQDILNLPETLPPHRFYVFSCHAEAAKANFLKTQSSVEVILNGSNHPTLIEFNLEAISILIREGHLPHLPLEGGVNYSGLYDHVTIVKKNEAITYIPIDLSTPDMMAMVSAGIASGGTPQITTMETLQKRLLLAIDHGEIEEVQQLLDLQIDPNQARTLSGLTPLHLAVYHGHTEIAVKLLTYDANLNAENINGFTPLHIAAQQGHTAAVEMLITYGADKDYQNENGLTPLHIAAQNGNATTVATLITLGAALNLTDKDKFTPLHAAAQNGSLATVQVLLANGANPNAENDEKATPLHYAVYNGHTEIVETLFTYNANPDSANDKGATPLHLAAYYGLTEMVEKLLTHDANPSLQDIFGKTPKDYLVHVKDPATKAAIERMLEQAERKSQEELSVLPTLDSVDVGNIAYKESGREQSRFA